MKFSTLSASLAVFLILLSPTLLANSFAETRGEADSYYTQQNYKKAYKLYHKLAKQGDHYSQDKLANMLAAGEGKKVDFAEAYAWSTLAAQSSDDALGMHGDDFLAQADDKAKAEKKANKLMKKYGQEALEERARKLENRRRTREMGGCTGSKMGCSGR